jgi:hypothetical protein
VSHHRFTNNVLPAGRLPAKTFGRLAATFEFASHLPLAGGANTGRHIYLALRIPNGAQAGLYEAAVNIRSDTGTTVQFAEKLEHLNAADILRPGFTSGVQLAYGTGPGGSDVDFLGLSQADFQEIVNDQLYDKISNLTSGSTLVVVYGVTYAPVGSGIHDVHMNSGTDPNDSHAQDDRDHEDGAIAFYFDLGNGQAFAHWVFIKFVSQSILNDSES